MLRSCHHPTDAGDVAWSLKMGASELFWDMGIVTHTPGNRKGGIVRLEYLSGNGDSAVFTVEGQGECSVRDKQYMIIQVTGSVKISVPGAGEAYFSNDDVCLCTRQYDAPSFYLQRVQPV